MISTGNGTGPQRSVRYVFGGALVLLGIATYANGSAWYLSLGLVLVGVIAIVGSRRIFRAGVDRTADEIVCRYVPWYEGNVYIADVGVPIFAITLIVASFLPGNPVWPRFGGIVLLLLLPLFLDSARRLRRKSMLRISPAALTVPLAAPKFTPVEIPREHIVSIRPTAAPSVSGAKAVQVEISYSLPTDGRDASGVVLLGPQLTIEPKNLLAALLTWRAAENVNPLELMDQIERILRRPSTATV